jgi:predicted HNH restriction endonuclease
MPYKDPTIRKAKHQEYSRQWYAKNKALVAKRGKVRKREYKAKWLEYKASKACKECGISHPALLDFHHVIRFEKKSIPQLINRRQYAMAIREAEEKCIPLCANCHRMLHWKEHRRERTWLRMTGKKKTY